MLNDNDFNYLLLTLIAHHYKSSQLFDYFDWLVVCKQIVIFVKK